VSSVSFFMRSIWTEPTTVIRDFPGGEGESKFVGRATTDDLKTLEGRRMFGFEEFDGIPNVDFAKKVNQIIR
jgi:hypothetical protein